MTVHKNEEGGIKRWGRAAIEKKTTCGATENQEDGILINLVDSIASLQVMSVFSPIAREELCLPTLLHSLLILCSQMSNLHTGQRFSWRGSHPAVAFLMGRTEEWRPGLETWWPQISLSLFPSSNVTAVQTTSKPTNYTEMKNLV